jgi:hypothetical protein
LSFLFEEINALKTKVQFKPEKTAGNKKGKERADSIHSTEINLTTSSDGGEENLYTSSKPFSSSKTKVAKASHQQTNNHCAGGDQPD